MFTKDQLKALFARFALVLGLLGAWMKGPLFFVKPVLTGVAGFFTWLNTRDDIIDLIVAAETAGQLQLKAVAEHHVAEHQVAMLERPAPHQVHEFTAAIRQDLIT